jgi:dynactin complex subunit
MSDENWHEERDRLVQLLEGIESGEVTHIDESNDQQLEPTNPKNVAGLKDRLAELNDRLGNDGK